MLAKQRNGHLHSEFRSDVPMYPSHLLIFVDESGTDVIPCKNMGISAGEDTQIIQAVCSR